MWRQFKAHSALTQVVPFLAVMAVGTVVALLGYRSFVSNLSDFLDLLLVIFIPWSAVNQTDYFLVTRDGAVGDFFRRDGRFRPPRLARPETPPVRADRLRRARVRPEPPPRPLRDRHRHPARHRLRQAFDQLAITL